MRRGNCLRTLERKYVLLMVITTLFVRLSCAAATAASGRNAVDAGESIEIGARIKLVPDVEHHKISPYIYGQFIEHIGGCIYDG
ncbi:MAG: hypothetical protein ACYTBJ_02495, partial [Planctomycetota bacterium]